MSTEPTATAVISHPIPILRVADIARSLAYYTGSLGFKIDWQAGNFASVTRDKCTFFLTEDAQGHFGTWVWTGVTDVQPLFAEWQTTGALIRQGPTNFPWGSLEIQIADLDGNVLRFGSDAIPGEPFGPWTDAEGKLWPMD